MKEESTATLLAGARALGLGVLAVVAYSSQPGSVAAAAVNGCGICYGSQYDGNGEPLFEDCQYVNNGAQNLQCTYDDYYYVNCDLHPAPCS
jgi:hypothetical protein